MSVTRSEAAELRREGRADAAVLLVAYRVVPSMELADWGRKLDLEHRDLVAAVDRFKERARPATPPRTRKVRPAGERIVPCPHDGCNVSCLDLRGLSAHLRSHETAVCDLCDGTFNRLGLGPHRRHCTGPSHQGEPA